MPPENTNQAEQINQISSEIANDLSLLLLRQKRARRRKFINSIIVVLFVVVVGCFSMIYQSRRSAVLKEYSLTTSSFFSDRGFKFTNFVISYPSTWVYREASAPEDFNAILFSLPERSWQFDEDYGDIMLYLGDSSVEDSIESHRFTDSNGKVIARIERSSEDNSYQKEFEQMISSFKIIPKNVSPTNLSN